MTTRAIGIIGVGRMGHGIAMNIAKAGWTLRYLHHPGNQPTEDLDAAGAVAINERRELARRSDIVILCVTGSPQVEDILLSDDGIVSALRPGTVIVDCSTAIPDSTRRIAEQVTRHGACFIDAAMTRTPREAAAGRLNLLVGGPEATVEAMRPLFETYAESIVHAGPVASGHTLKLLHNYISLGSALLLGEAAACAEHAGIDAHTFVDVLAAGGGAGAALERMAPYILDADASRLNFSIANARKDLAYYNRMAQDLGAYHGAARGVLEAYEHLVDNGHGEASVPEQVKWLT